MSKKRAHRIFASLSRDLAELTENYPAQVLCPLCLAVYTERAIDLTDPLLTEEHIIPEELGGKLVTLTCKTCNNTHGAKLDAHLVQRVRSHDVISGRSDRRLRGRIEVGGITIPTDVEWKAPVGGTNVFHLRQFDQRRLDTVYESLRSGASKTIGLNLRFDYIPSRVGMAVLRIGYLGMFSKFGYRYLFSPAARVIREIIWSFENPPAELGRLVAELTNISPIPSEPLLFYALGETAVMIIITLKAETTRYFLTLMPRPECQADQVMDALRRASDEVELLMRPKSSPPP